MHGGMGAGAGQCQDAAVFHWAVGIAAFRGAPLLDHRGEGRRKDLADFLRQPGRQEAAQEMNCRSTGTRNPLASRFVSFARPATASSSMSIASVMPFLRAAAVCEYVQYSQPLVALTAT